MIRIRPAQMEAFEQAASRAFERQLRQFLAEEHGASIEGRLEEEVAAGIRRGIRRAAAYGITDEASVAQFVALLFAIGPAFDRQPFIQAVLSDAAIPPQRRMEVLAECAVPEHWTEAAALRR